MRTLVSRCIAVTLVVAACLHVTIDHGPALARNAPLVQTPSPPPQAKPAKPTNRPGERKLESTIAAVEKIGDTVRITLKDGSLTVTVKPSTELVQEERWLVASDLKVGDRLSLITFKPKAKGSLKEKAVVTAVNPLVLKISEVATLTVDKVENVEFNRYTPLPASALAAGQTVALEMRVLRDGQIEAKRIAVVIVKAKEPGMKKPRGKAVEKKASAKVNCSLCLNLA